MQQKITVYNCSYDTLQDIKQLIWHFPSYYKFFGKDFIKDAPPRLGKFNLNLVGKQSIYFENIDLQCPNEVELILNQTQAMILYYMFVKQGYHYLRTKFAASCITEYY